jgi:hypothetical protein
MKMNKKIRKYFKLIGVSFIFPFSSFFVINAANAKINIDTIFGDTVDMSCDLTPSDVDVINYLADIGTQQGYSNVGNQLMVDSRVDNDILVVANPKSREYTGNVTVIYHATDKLILSDVVEQENIS